MLEWLAQQCRDEVDTIKGAPIAFALSVVFVGAIIYFVLEWFHGEKYEIQQQRIDLLQGQVSSKEESIDSLHGQVTDLYKEVSKINSVLKGEDGIGQARTFYEEAETLKSVESKLQNLAEESTPEKAENPEAREGYVRKTWRIGE